jgi:hypothetical protein
MSKHAPARPLREVTAAYIDAALAQGADPLDLLAQAALLRDEQPSYYESLVKAAWKNGSTWEQIGGATGCSEHVARERFIHLVL